LTPIRRKKSSASSTGTPESFFVCFFRGIRTRAPGASLRQQMSLCLWPALLPEAEPVLSARLGAVPSRRLYSPRLEKRSPALQRCHRTSNIQADGVPMAHRAPGVAIPQGSCFAIGHRSYALKTHRHSHSRRSLPKHGSASASARSQALRWSGDPCRPATYRGLSAEVHEDYRA
jgi:hypothetical protein